MQTKKSRGAMDYGYDKNSGIMAVKWVDNSVVNLESSLLRKLANWGVG